jgi:ankyrin repeat protein
MLLQIATEGNNVSTVERLLELGLDPNTLYADESYPALTSAVRHGYACTVQVLLKTGADVNAKSGIAAAHWALQLLGEVLR